MCELTLVVSHPPPQEKNMWFKRSHTTRSSIRSRWRLPVDCMAPRMDFRSFYIYLLFLVRLPLCNKYSDFIRTFISIVYTLCYYIWCLLWCMYEMHLACPLNPGVTLPFSLPTSLLPQTVPPEAVGPAPGRPTAPGHRRAAPPGQECARPRLRPRPRQEPCTQRPTRRQEPSTESPPFTARDRFFPRVNGAVSPSPITLSLH
jgi:hypothetical protein